MCFIDDVGGLRCLITHVSLVKKISFLCNIKNLQNVSLFNLKGFLNPSPVSAFHYIYVRTHVNR